MIALFSRICLFVLKMSHKVLKSSVSTLTRFYARSQLRFSLWPDTPSPPAGQLRENYHDAGLLTNLLNESK